MLPSEKSIQEVVKDCVSFGSADESHLLHLCFKNITEYGPDVLLDKNAIFSDFIFFMKPAYIQVLIKKNNAWSKNTFIYFLNRGSDLYFDMMHVQISIQLNILGAMTKLFSKTLIGKELIDKIWLKSKILHEFVHTFFMITERKPSVYVKMLSYLKM